MNDQAELKQFQRDQFINNVASAKRFDSCGPISIPATVHADPVQFPLGTTGSGSSSSIKSNPYYIAQPIHTQGQLSG